MLLAVMVQIFFMYSVWQRVDLGLSTIIVDVLTKQLPKQMEKPFPVLPCVAWADTPIFQKNLRGILQSAFVSCFQGQLPTSCLLLWSNPLFLSDDLTL